MTVAELIEALKGYDQELPVVYQCCSEHTMLEAKQIEILDLCEPRHDDWVHDKRPDKPTRQYLAFPGN